MTGVELNFEGVLIILNKFELNEDYDQKIKKKIK